MATGPIEAKERLIKDYQTKAADLRQLLESFDAGTHWTSEGRVDTTAKDIAQIKGDIAEYERCIAAIEKELRDT